MITTTELYTQEDAHQNEQTLNFAIDFENWQ
jgi:hypothetical protein